MPWIKTHKNDYENKTEEEFDEVGMEMLGREVGGSKVTHDRRFISNFGCLPPTCATLWHRLLTSGHEAFMVEVKSLVSKKSKKRFYPNCPPYKACHLLWALHLMMCYPTENQGISIINCDEKTFRKWAWAFIEALSSLKNEVVSKKMIRKNFIL